MPSTQRTPPPGGQETPQASQHQEGATPTIDFHGDVIRVIKAGEATEQPRKGFAVTFKNKNAHVKRTITRTLNVLVPLETNNQARLHTGEITLLRDHLRKIDAALDSLNDIIDEEAPDIQEDRLQPYLQEADAHVPTILDLRTRINLLEDMLNAKNRILTQPALPAAPQKRSFTKIDNTFRPKPLHIGATPPAFNKWKRDFNIYVRRNGFDEAPIDEQRVLLYNCLTPELGEELERLCVPKDTDKLDDVVNSMEKHLLKSNNLVSQRFAYFNCVQKPDESIRAYIVRFRSLGDYSDFDHFLYNDNMVLRLLTGIHDEDLRRALLRLPKMDFDTVQNYALSWDYSGVNSDNIAIASRPSSTSSATDVSVDKVSTYKSNRKAQFTSTSSRTSSPADTQNGNSTAKPGQERRSCFNCGQSTHPRSSCPARDRTCSYCSKMGHFAKVCRRAKSNRHKASSAKPGRGVDEVQEANQSDDDAATSVGNLNFDVYNIDRRDKAPTPKLQASLTFKNRHLGTYPMLPDTGAAISVLPSRFLQHWSISPRPLSPGDSFHAANGTPINCIGTVSLQITVPEASTVAKFYVCQDVNNILLSWMALKNLALIPRGFPQQSISNVTKVKSDSFADFKRECLSKYASVFDSDQFLSEMRGDPMRIHLKDAMDRSQIRPVTRPRPVPVPLRSAVHEQLMDMVKKKIIRSIQEPTEFVSPMVVVPKKDNSVRLVVDYTQLNKFIKRPSHPFPSIAEVRASIPPGAKFFATLDAVQGYLQIPLHQASQPLTTFLTPWGRFCYCRAPMGLSSSGDEYCARGDRAFSGIDNFIKVVDDILVFAETQGGLFNTISSVLDAAQAHGVSLSPAKFSIGTTVDFVGLTISQDSIQPDAKHFAAIAQFPEPSNKTDLRSFLGLANQFAPFSTDIAALAKPLRPLLSKNSAWHWSDEHKNAFNSLRRALVNSQRLHCFDPTRKTRLLTDASRLHGLGYALMQYYQDKWVLVSCGSRFVTDTEANYAVFELEALAIVWAIQKCRIFLLGLPSFDVVTDHRPLVSIFNTTRLAKTDNPRLIRLLQKVSMYSFQVSWVPGRTHSIPDALSRSPLPNVQAQISEVDTDAPVAIHPDAAVQAMAQQARDDPAYQDIINAIKTLNINDLKKLPLSTHSHVRILASMWNRLSVDPSSGLVLLDMSRIFVPGVARQVVVDRIHAAHQGVTRTRARMQSIYFWPGMANQIVQAIQACQLCQKFRDEQPSEPLIPHQPPPRPFHSVSVDVFEYKRSFFMTYVDRFSGWPSVAHFRGSPSSAQIMSALENIFKDFGVPQNIRHDGATPFVSDTFIKFLKNHGIRDQLTSAYNPQSNGHAEASVKAMKLLVKKCWLANSLDRSRFSEAILEWRNTPRYPGNLSPAQLVFGRATRTKAPCISYDQLHSDIIRKAVHDNHNYITKNYRQSNFRTRQLPRLHPGDRVFIRNRVNRTWDKSGVIKGIRDHGRSYLVDVEGKIILRNRRLLRRKHL